MAKQKVGNGLPASESLETSTIIDTALGLRKTDKGFEMVVIKYNVETGEAKIVEQVFMGDHRPIAFGDFKMRIVKEGFAG